jgi:pyrroline-5-carboxylate reductase
MLRAVGDAIAVPREALLNPVTGLSGSGPAYVYRFAEALIAAGRKQGLSAEISRRLTLQTLEGAVAMLRDSGETPVRLREMVSSPGGTTIAGLASLEDDGFFEAVGRAVAQATSRSKELGR